jgi:hypothetical protein
VAHQLGSPALLESAQTSFVAGLDDALRVAAGVAVIAIVLALLFLPARTAATQSAEVPNRETGAVPVV